MFGVTGLHFSRIRQAEDDNKFTSLKGKFNYGLWSFFWIAGHILGGVFVCGLAAWLGTLLHDAVNVYGLIILGVLMLVGALHQFRFFRLPIPELERQVSRLWMHRLNWNIVALGYGFQLGSGIATRIRVITTYAVIICAFLSGSVISGVIIGIAFGLSRAFLPVIVAPRVASPIKSLQFVASFNSYNDAVQKINGAILLASAIFLTGFLFFSTNFLSR